VSDRVSERRRAAQLACHYRDQEDLTIAEIARRLGRAEATINAYLHDPHNRSTATTGRCEEPEPTGADHRLALAPGSLAGVDQGLLLRSDRREGSGATRTSTATAARGAANGPLP
jgi:hypothetical protein